MTYANVNLTDCLKTVPFGIFLIEPLIVYVSITGYLKQFEPYLKEIVICALIYSILIRGVFFMLNRRKKEKELIENKVSELEESFKKEIIDGKEINVLHYISLTPIIEFKKHSIKLTSNRRNKIMIIEVIKKNGTIIKKKEISYKNFR